MNTRWKLTAVRLIFSILFIVSLTFGPAQIQAMAQSQAHGAQHAVVAHRDLSSKNAVPGGTPIPNTGGGTITISRPSGPTASSGGSPAGATGKITTSISAPPATPAGSNPAPASGKITTSLSPAVANKGVNINATVPSFSVNASCAPNSVGLMTITNTGSDMTVPFTWRISLNGVPIAQNSFQLTAGQTFNINTSGLYGTLTLDVLDTTNAVVATGSMFCLSPTATPTLVPPSFQVSASCAPNSVGLMTITNTGGDMLSPFTWRISLNGTPIAQNTFQLTSGQTFNVNTSGLYGTLTLDVLDTTNTVVATGSMFCLSPTATPTLVPPSFQVTASCAPNSDGLLTITNTGGNMFSPFTWRLSLNGVPVAQNTFQISPGQSFNISTSGLYGTLTMDVLDPSNTVVATGSTFCLSPTATPTLVPPSFQVTASCAPNSDGLLIITNTGGNMFSPFTWRLSLNGVPVAQNTFQISPGQSFNISTSGLYGTLTMDVLDPTNTVVATGSTFCLSPTATGGPTATDTATETVTPLPTDTATFTVTPSPTDTATFTDTPSPTDTATFTVTPSSTFTNTPSPTATKVPVPPRVITSYPSDKSRLEKGPSRIVIIFSQDLIHDGSANAANNPANYMLVENGADNKFQTTSCQTGHAGDDVAVAPNSVQYQRVYERNHISYVATLKLNPALPAGQYRLFVCGSTSIENLAGVKLNNGVDTVISFSVSGDKHKPGDNPQQGPSTTGTNGASWLSQITLASFHPFGWLCQIGVCR